MPTQCEIGYDIWFTDISNLSSILLVVIHSHFLFTGRKKSIAKAEGVTRIGNNTYYYTGEKDQEGATADGNADTEEELDDRPEGKHLKIFILF